MSGLELLRAPFPAHQISKLPKPTAAQTADVKADFKKGIRCQLCGAWHHKDVVHLDYVGHAALTDRLLDADPAWYWEPAALKDGLPCFDQSGGLWIKLTVCGVTRLGYGHAATTPNQDPGAREKEVIGDALRNAAMRFGAALDLWHKGDLHADDVAEPTPIVARNNPPRDTGKTDAPAPRAEFEAAVSQAVRGIGREPTHDSLSEMFKDLYRRQRSVADDPRVIKAKDDRKAALQPKPNADLADEIPY